MNLGLKTALVAFKSAILATSLLCLTMLSMKDMATSDIVPFFLISIIITFIISVVGITFTIFPFYLDKADALDVLFKKYLPFYAMLMFIACLIFVIKIEIKIGTLISGITYTTAMFAWVWFFKPEKTQIN